MSNYVTTILPFSLLDKVYVNSSWSEPGIERTPHLSKEDQVQMVAKEIPNTAAVFLFKHQNNKHFNSSVSYLYEISST